MIEDFLDSLRYQKRCSLHTIVAYERDIRQFVAWLGSEQALLTIEHSDVRSWLLVLLEKGEKNTTINRKMSSLKSFYRYLMREGKIKTNPLASVILPKKEKRLPTFLKEKETTALFEDIEYPATFEGMRDELILQLFYATGMRVSELANLTQKSVDVNRKVLKVLGKRNKERFIPLLDFIIPSMQNYLAECREQFGECEYIFVDKKGRGLNRGQLYYIVKKYLSQVSSSLKRSPHILRHTFATQLLNGGADLNALKELLGHSSLAATQVYTHSTKEQLKKDYKQAHPRA